MRETSATEATSSAGLPFEVGRTFYTFTSANTIVGFAPGSTAPTRTVTMPAFNTVSDLTCDGSNLYLGDSGSNTIYGIGPAATSPVTYSSSLSGADWVGANGGRSPSTYARMFVGNGTGPGGVVVFQGSTSGPPFPLPPDSASSTYGSGSRASIVVDPAGNIFTAFGGPTLPNSGYGARDSTLTVVLGQGNNYNTAPGDLIAVDSSVSPPRIYVSTNSLGTLVPEVDEYDNYPSSPTYISQDSNDTGLFVDSTGRIYTSKFGVGTAERSRAPGRGTAGTRRRTLAGTGNVFDVYAPGALAGAVQYTIPGASLAFDSANYVYALQDGGSVNVYAPGSSTLVTTIPGTTYGSPSPNTFAFGTFCR